MLYRLVLVTVAAALLGPAPVFAQGHVGGQVSFAQDVDFGVGLRLAYDMDESVERLQLVGTFDYFFPGEGLTYYEVNANGLYELPLPMESLRPYLGGGVNVARSGVDADVGEGTVSDTQLGLNALLGARGSQSGSITPFAELRVELLGGEQFLLTAGFVL